MGKWSLNLKISVVVAVLVSTMVFISYLGLSRMSSINDALNDIVGKNAARLAIALEIKSLFYLQLMNEKTFILEDTKESMQQVRNLMDKRHEEVKKLCADLHAISTELGKEEITKFLETYEAWFKKSEEVQAHAWNGDDAKAIELSRSVTKGLRAEAEKYILSTTDRNQKVMDREAKEAHELYLSSRSLVMAISLFSILFGITLAAIVLVKLSRTINRVVTDLSHNGDQVNLAAQQISSASQGLAQASTEQASSLEETVASVEELTSMVKVNSENARQAAELSNSTGAVAARGEKEIRDLVTSMNEISSDSKKIEEIINVIDDIAFQTNLLALNAAVEAARAGEQGKGFAVVADAVRALAQRSASAAKDIAGLIKGSVTKIEVGSSQANQSGAVLAEILDSVKKVVQLNNEIASASEEQSNGIAQISKALNQLDQTTQVNAASSEEAAAAAEELSAQAQSLSNVVILLEETIKGASAKTEHAIPPEEMAQKNLRSLPEKINAAA
ncbi:MAG: MCP four helix bundle domain-containing protein [Bdellovibrionales bacterium]|nr:MCP four helix bundle domain-containing protein [Bdellovibrionales bacterium]